jgi:RNA polymerase sigma-70 factor (ECF subfamily)
MTDLGAGDTDEALMAAYSSGDNAAFDHLYSRHKGALYRFLRRLLGSSHASHVDEVFQETWIKVIEARSSWEPEGARFRGWLFTVANSKAMNVFRRPLEKPIDEDQDNDSLGVDAEVGWMGMTVIVRPEDLFYWNEIGKHLLQCMEGLSFVQRGAFLLRHQYDLSVEEVAHIQDVAMETAKSRLRYALKGLRDCMKPHREELLSADGETRPYMGSRSPLGDAPGDQCR